MAMTRRWAALGGLVGPGAFIAAWSVLGATADDYSPVTDAISRLAAADAPTRTAMTAGLVTFGTGVPVYALALRSTLPGPAWVAAAATGLSALVVAAFPLDAGNDGLHGAFAAAGYATLAAVPLLAAGPLVNRGRRHLAGLSAAAGLVSTGCLLATVLGRADGLFQRTGLTAGHLWIMGSAVVILRMGHRGGPNS